MMKKLFVLALLVFAPLAWADCKLTLSSEFTYKGKPDGGGSVWWNDLPSADATTIKGHGNPVVDAANKAKDKGGDYGLTLTEKTVCDGAEAPSVPLPFSGLNIKGVLSVLRAMNKAESNVIKMGEDSDKKGMKRAWGKQ